MSVGLLVHLHIYICHFKANTNNVSSTSKIHLNPKKLDIGSSWCMYVHVMENISIICAGSGDAELCLE
jgi:hypothetical protein